MENKEGIKVGSVFFLIFLILLISILFIYKTHTQSVSKELVECIGNNSKLFVQLGCSHCLDQEKIFGDNFKFLNSIDCYYFTEECILNNITSTPTWIIKNKYYEGVQSIKYLQNLTGC
jgi:hypothetical protein